MVATNHSNFLNRLEELAMSKDNLRKPPKLESNEPPPSPSNPKNNTAMNKHIKGMTAPGQSFNTLSSGASFTKSNKGKRSKRRAQKKSRKKNR